MQLYTSKQLDRSTKAAILMLCSAANLYNTHPDKIDTKVRCLLCELELRLLETPRIHSSGILLHDYGMFCTKCYEFESLESSKLWRVSQRPQNSMC